MLPGRSGMSGESESSAAQVVDQLQQQMATLGPFPRLHLALSGGRDSTVLLHILARHQPRPSLSVLHVDHGLHPHSGDWAAQCQALCDSLGLSCRVLQLDMVPKAGESLEAQARDARYQALAECVGPGEALLTAHHADDQLETLLYRLLRGTGGRGLAGIRIQRPLGEGWLLRPMLALNGEAIQSLAEAWGLSWLEDPSNQDARFDRNFLRQRVLPRLAERWPAGARRAVATAEHLAEDSELLSELAELDRQTVAVEGGLSVSGLLGLSAARRRNLLRHWLMAATGQMPAQRQLRLVDEEVLQARQDATPLLKIGARRLSRHRDYLFLEPHGSEGPFQDLAPGPFQWLDPDQPLSLPGNGQLLLEAAEGGEPGLDIRQLGHSLRVRYRRAGDRFHDGRHHRALKEWLRLAEIPPRQRARLPLLLDGEEIIAAGENLLNPRYQCTNGREGRRIVWRKAPE